MSRAHAITTTDVSDAHLGWVLTDELRASDGRTLVRKGGVLDQAALACFAEAEPAEVHLVELELGELHEDAAGLRVARAVVGEGVRATGPMQSRIDLIADRKGLLRVDAGLLRAINGVEDVTVYSLLDWQPVVPETVLASVKITPVAIPEARVAEVESRCREADQPLLAIQPFLPKRVAVVATDELDTAGQERFSAAIERKVRWYGAELAGLRFVAADARAVADAFAGFLRDGSEILLAAGGNTIDPLDPIGQALALIDAQMVHRGAPTRGSMFWLAQVGDVPIVNLASARMYIGGAVGDLILPLLMAGHRVTREDILDIGYGGLPGSAISFRFPPYDAG